jgi:hypothetical protein
LEEKVQAPQILPNGPTDKSPPNFLPGESATDPKDPEAKAL